MKNESLKKKAYYGAAWTIFGYGLSQSLRLGSNIILTKLLVPEVFGLMALSYVFITGLNLFSDIGIAPSIIRHEKGEDSEFLDTAWTIQIVRGCCLFIGCLLIAWPASKVYNEPLLFRIIPSLGVSVLIKGFQSTSLATLKRHMKIGRLTSYEIGLQLINLFVTLTLVFWLRSIWALVLANIISSLLRCLTSHFLIKKYWRKFAWEKEALNEFFTFGRWVLLATAFSFLAEQSDRMLLGNFFTTKLLGIYTIAITFAEIQRQVVAKMNSLVLFPSLSRALAKEPRSVVRYKTIKNRKFLLLVLIVLTTFLFNFGDIIIYTLYDPRYYDAAWMLPILAVGVWPLVLHSTVNPVLLAIGKPYYNAAGNLSKFLYMLLLIPFVSNAFGIVGTIIVIAFNDIPSYLITQHGLFREKFTVIRQDLWTTLLLLISLILVMMIRYQLGFGFSFSRLLEA